MSLSDTANKLENILAALGALQTELENTTAVKACDEIRMQACSGFVDAMDLALEALPIEQIGHDFEANVINGLLGRILLRERRIDATAKKRAGSLRVRRAVKTGKVVRLYPN